MNCGFEDVRILRSLLLSHSVSAASASEDDALAAALQEYSTSRHKDLLAISRLTKRNYVEMRSSVATVGYRARKRLDGTLAKLLGGRWLPL